MITQCYVKSVLDKYTILHVSPASDRVDFWQSAQKQNSLETFVKLAIGLLDTPVFDGEVIGYLK